MSRINDSEEIISSQKKKENLYPNFEKVHNTISPVKKNNAIMVIISKIISESFFYI